MINRTPADLTPADYDSDYQRNYAGPRLQALQNRLDDGDPKNYLPGTIQTSRHEFGRIGLDHNVEGSTPADVAAALIAKVGEQIDFVRWKTENAERTRVSENQRVESVQAAEQQAGKASADAEAMADKEDGDKAESETTE